MIPIDPSKWIGNYHIQYTVRGITLAVDGPVRYLIRCYVYLNTVLADWEHVYCLSDFVKKEFHPSDNQLPDFICNEFVRVYKPIDLIAQTKKSNSTNISDNLTKEQVEDITNFCGLLFKCIYISFRSYEFDIDTIESDIAQVFCVCDDYYNS